MDRYCVTPGSPRSAGTTTIWFQNDPVWVMNYGGFYYKEAIPLLRSALREAYQAHRFVGGRGPLIFRDTQTDWSLVYINRPLLDHFHEFVGREEIIDSVGERRMGFHDYWGMSLL